MNSFNGKMNIFICVSVFVLLQIFHIILAITADSDGNSVNEFHYCLRKPAHRNLKECVGRTVINFLQRFEEKDNFTFIDDVVATRSDNIVPRSLVNFLDSDPIDFRGILENAGAVFSQRALQFHMDAIYPGLMFKIGPSANANSLAEFVIDPTVDERNFNYEDSSTARILTKQYVLPFLLGLKFNLAALVPILFTIMCLLLKKSLFIAKLVVYVSSILGIGGVAGALGTFGGLGSFLGGPEYPHPHPHPHGHRNAGGHLVGFYPGKNTVYSLYDHDELQHNSLYKRQDRKVVFEKIREDSEHINVGNRNNGRLPAAIDHFYDYEKQFLIQDHSDKLRHSNSKLRPSVSGENVEDATDIISVTPSHHFKTNENTGWKVINVRV